MFIHAIQVYRYHTCSCLHLGFFFRGGGVGVGGVCGVCCCVYVFVVYERICVQLALWTCITLYGTCFFCDLYIFTYTQTHTHTHSHTEHETNTSEHCKQQLYFIKEGSTETGEVALCPRGVIATLDKTREINCTQTAITFIISDRD